MEIGPWFGRSRKPSIFMMLDWAVFGNYHALKLTISDYAGRQNALHPHRGLLWGRFGAAIERTGAFERDRDCTCHSCSPESFGGMPQGGDMLWRCEACKLSAEVALPLYRRPPGLPRHSSCGFWICTSYSTCEPFPAKAHLHQHFCL